jgi:Protein of unknown function (DUF3606)
MDGNTRDVRTGVPRAKIDMQASVELTAWANALHVTEAELTDVVARVGNDAREVITYVLKRPTPRAPRKLRGR